MKFPGTIRILKAAARTVSRPRNVNCTKNTLETHTSACVCISPRRGMHMWGRSGSQSHSASSQMHLHHWRGRAVHRGPKKTSAKPCSFSNSYTCTGPGKRRNLMNRLTDICPASRGQSTASSAWTSLSGISWLTDSMFPGRTAWQWGNIPALWVPSWRKYMLLCGANNQLDAPTRSLGKVINQQQKHEVPGMTRRAPFSSVASSKASQTDRTGPPAMPQYLPKQPFHLHTHTTIRLLCVWTTATSYPDARQHMEVLPSHFSHQGWWLGIYKWSGSPAGWRQGPGWPRQLVRPEGVWSAPSPKDTEDEHCGGCTGCTLYLETGSEC